MLMMLHMTLSLLFFLSSRNVLDPLFITELSASTVSYSKNTPGSTSAQWCSVLHHHYSWSAQSSSGFLWSGRSRSGSHFQDPLIARAAHLVCVPCLTKDVNSTRPPRGAQLWEPPALDRIPTMFATLAPSRNARFCAKLSKLQPPLS
ncbi:uncharacterized protein BDR25DRAFT_361230 [Lindgomyces ingoldianus]|uniref:Uncharacterized protein n=1 Tax=Lindgomyces ingoldianus TaxID=673940 RepID=A0ACB6QCB5_9PLEO|nr:uncharacterized protein BDR25DRAFT_361230 [Lindgomyces ingoldianus]KAF2464684.1 hypothetical protein BDR25DRAFT_361230 [Lindgomyces ingoldianus]